MNRSVDQAEKNVLSVLVEHPEKFLTITEKLPVAMFQENKVLAYAIYEQFQELGDLSFRHIADNLGEDEALELEGFIQLDKIEADLKVIKKNYNRTISEKLYQNLQLANGDEGQMFSYLKQAIGLLQGDKKEDETLLSVAAELSNEIIDDVKVESTPFGMKSFDFQLGGLQPNYYIIAARPSMGKTQLTLQLAFYQALQGKQVVFASYEMDARSLAKRLQRMYSQVDAFKELHGPDKTKVVEAYKQIAKENLIILTGRNYRKVDDLVRKVYFLHAQGKCDSLFVDYLQKLKGKRGDIREQVHYVSGELQDLRVTLNIPVIALSQLSRGVEARTDRKPLLSDLRESGDIEQDADIVLMLYRGQYYGLEDSNEVIIRKNRNGSLGTIYLGFDEGIWHEPGQPAQLKPAENEEIPF